METFVPGTIEAGTSRPLRIDDGSHSMASNPRATGVGVVTVPRFMSDACPQITLAIHSHVISKRRNAASELLATLMRDSRNATEEAETPDAIQASPGAPKSLDLLEASAGIEPAYADVAGHGSALPVVATRDHLKIRALARRSGSSVWTRRVTRRVKILRWAHCGACFWPIRADSRLAARPRSRRACFSGNPARADERRHRAAFDTA